MVLADKASSLASSVMLVMLGTPVRDGQGRWPGLQAEDDLRRFIDGWKTQAKLAEQHFKSTKAGVHALHVTGWRASLVPTQ